MNVTATAGWRAIVLGSDPRQRLRASQALLALAVYAVFATVQHAEVLMGLIDEAASWRLTAFNLGGAVVFFAVIRSGLNQRVGGDPSLTWQQTLWSMVGVSWSYAITGPARGAVMLIMMLIILFGIFALSPRQARMLAGTGFVMLAAVMVWKAVVDPARYDPRVEVLHFVFAGIVMGACAKLSIRLGHMRSRLEKQRSDLSTALERIQSLATRDDLTGLLNRRAVTERLQIELRERDRASPRLAVALIDLDHFKRINDGFGHATGDTVLRRFADLARTEIRGGDILARWGGEEFLLVMPGADAQQGLGGLARLRDRLRTAPMDDIAAGLVVTFSAGLAVCSGEADMERAIERADVLMYAAKQAGRDRAFGPAPAAPAECANLADSVA